MGGSFKTLFGTLVVLGFILVLSIGGLPSEANKTKTTLTTQSSSSTLGKRHEEHVKVLGKGESSSSSSSSSSPSVVHPQLDLNYMSKRRVPNGPDPIHNRRAGNSKRPPGQA
ncbi:hypothetical protein CCACVL1_25875 [Corchorus capsularis]|uniref:CLAVATA3/ESR (CLE)-related protein 25-like protein n=1 Tax=Corchorus capsularis TaxID=210143 RepID=A0A1R3GGW9_COCAP|nr:hypothetical protein CCACVL1_25875 [Corchorus capsularis]